MKVEELESALQAEVQRLYLERTCVPSAIIRQQIEEAVYAGATVALRMSNDHLIQATRAASAVQILQNPAISPMV